MVNWDQTRSKSGLLWGVVSAHPFGRLDAFMLPSTTLSILQPLLALFYPTTTTDSRIPFELRQLHAISPEGHVVFSDITQQSSLAAVDYSVNTRKIKSSRPSSPEAYSNARTRSIKFGQSVSLDWDEEEVLAPDVEDRDTLLVLAKMTNNAYLEPNETQWYDLGNNWTAVRAFQHLRATSSLSSLPGVSLRLGTGPRWVQGPCFCYTGQLNRGFIYQRDFGGYVRRRWSNCKEGQVER